MCIRDRRNTRQTVDEYREKRKRVHSKCGKKKRLFEKNRLEDMRIRNVIRNFYLRGREIKKGFNPRPVFMKEKTGRRQGRNVRNVAELFPRNC